MVQGKVELKVGLDLAVLLYRITLDFLIVEDGKAKARQGYQWAKNVCQCEMKALCCSCFNLLCTLGGHNLIYHYSTVLIYFFSLFVFVSMTSCNI